MSRQNLHFIDRFGGGTVGSDQLEKAPAERARALLPKGGGRTRPKLIPKSQETTPALRRVMQGQKDM